MSLYKFVEIIRQGTGNLLRHPGRSMLTILGILFGVCAVIATMSIVEGISRKMQQQILEMGTTNIIVRAVKPLSNTSSSGQSSGFVLSYGLTREDLRRIEAALPGAEVIAPVRRIWKKSRKGRHSVRVRIMGVEPRYRRCYRLEMNGGRWIAAVDIKKMANVCVLGAKTAKTLFSDRQPIGSLLRLGGDTYRVVGVVEDKNASSYAPVDSANEDFSRVVYIPLSTAFARFGEILIDRSVGARSYERCEFHEITVKMSSAKEVKPASQMIETLLDKYHDSDNRDWEMQIPLERLKTLSRIRFLFVILGLSIAAISLLVGGIGIMNIVLASVTERMNEIGVRRAIGATRKDIVVQFLVETVALSGVGGIAGVPAGIGIASALPWLVTKTAESLGIGQEAVLPRISETVITPEAVIVALGASIIVGIFSGIYPAYRAAVMDPVQALRRG